MSLEWKTPGVFVNEMPAFPPSVAQVETAIPAFVGYTENAIDSGKPLKNVPKRISSLLDYEEFFGGPPKIAFSVRKLGSGQQSKKVFSLGGDDWTVVAKVNRDAMFLLYASMSLFFANGGGPCYVVSVGSYDDAPIASSALISGIDLLEKEQEPTLLAIPDAVQLANGADCKATQQHMVQHCGATMKNRLAILDVYNGSLGPNDTTRDPVQDFRDGIGTNNLDFAAAYYPWLTTTVVTAGDITYISIDPDDLTAVLTAEAALSAPGQGISADVIAEVKQLSAHTADQLNAILNASSPVFREITAEIARQLSLLPPSGAIAGVYARVDSTSGVWKAPANVSVNSVVQPAVAISDQDQQGLAVDTQGKSINAIRNFVGRGVLIWGARTLDANSNDWRYVSVRRTVIMIEESIRLATEPFVFEPNNAVTWVKVKGMISNFLTGFWRQGALMGMKAEEAYFVQCGLNETMTANDVLEGIMRITIGIALVRPAEFVVITLQQQMQQS